MFFVAASCQLAGKTQSNGKSETCRHAGETTMSQPFFDVAQDVAGRITLAPHVLLGLDFDGTLARFADNPLAATLSTHMERVLLALAEHDHVSLAIISGRDRADLQAHVGIPNIFYAGNHGLEISGPGVLFIEPTAAAFTSALQALAEELARKLQGIEGVIVEFKGLTLSVHYRQVTADAVEEVRRRVHAVLAGAIHPFMLAQGEKVYEIRPRVYWNKGSAFQWIRQHLDKPNLLPIYVGDSTTDEDAFTALPDGITIKVRPEVETAARYTLAGPVEVRKFLEWMDDLLRQNSLQPVVCGN
jgi:trehalose-phosphatase